MSTPPRRDRRRTHLDASVVPVEQALLARAGQVGSDIDVVRRALRVAGMGVSDGRNAEVIAGAVAAVVAAEFRALAEELHWH